MRCPLSNRMVGALYQEAAAGSIGTDCRNPAVVKAHSGNRNKEDIFKLYLSICQKYRQFTLLLRSCGGNVLILPLQEVA